MKPAQLLNAELTRVGYGGGNWHVSLAFRFENIVPIESMGVETIDQIGNPGWIAQFTNGAKRLR